MGRLYNKIFQSFSDIIAPFIAEVGTNVRVLFYNFGIHN